MKPLQTIILFMAVSMCAMTAMAQPDKGLSINQAAIATQPLQASFIKTTHILFPSGILCVDKGSEDILVQKAEGVENILRVKAARDSFAQTNLTVITTDGSLYSFLVDFAANPVQLNIAARLTYTQDTTNNTSHPSVRFSSPASDDKSMKALFIKALRGKKNISGAGDKAYKMNAAVTGLYVSGDMFLYRIAVSNSSHVDYDVASLRFYVRDKKKAKRTATQQIEITALAVSGDGKTIRANSGNTIIAALPKQTIGNDKQLVIELTEKAGGRSLQCRIRNGKLLEALPIDPS